MAYVGASWFEGSWDATSWTSGAWKPYAPAIGQSWLHSIWAEDTWTATSWFPALDSATGGEIPRVKFKMRLVDLVTAQVAEGGSPTGYTLPAVVFVMKPGSVLDLEKTLPVARFTFSNPALDATIIEESIDEQTFGVVSQTFKAVDLRIGVILPVVQFVLSAPVFETIGLELGAVRLLLRPRVSNDGLNVTTSPSGLKDEHKKLVRRGKSMFRKSWTRAAEDLFNEIVDDVDAPDYGKET